MKLSKKIKNMKFVEKKFIIATIIFVLILLWSIIFIYPTLFSKILGNPKELNSFKISKNLYFLSPTLLSLMFTVPKAFAKTNSYFLWILGLEFFTWLVIAMPIHISRLKDSHGTARWATFDDLGYSGFFKPTKYAKAFEVNLLEEKGVVLGEFNGRILRDNGKTHILLSAPTRTGKGVSVIIPTLVDSWADSVFVLDVKGENYQMTGGWRKKEFGNDILYFSPKKQNSCHFNPLAEIRYLTEREIEDAKTIADLIVVGDEKSSDPFWEVSGSDFMLGVILYELYLHDGKAGLGDVVDFITDPSAPITDRMKEIINKPIFDVKSSRDKERMKILEQIYTTEKELVKKGFHPFISRSMADILGKGDKTMASIIATAKAKLSVFQLPTVKKNTADSDFHIIDLMAADKPKSLYIVIEPGDLQSLAPLLRILVIQCVTLLTPEMDYTGQGGGVKFKHRLLMLLDEFPAIGKMEILEKAIGYVAGYGMKMMIVVQSLDQLNKIYTKDNMFLSNCQTQVFYTANENATAEYISKTIGSKTIKTSSVSGGWLNKNISTSNAARELLKPEEIRRFPLDKILLLVGGKPPIITKKLLFFNDSRFKHKIKLPINPSEHMQAEMDQQKIKSKNASETNKKNTKKVEQKPKEKSKEGASDEKKS